MKKTFRKWKLYLIGIVILMIMSYSFFVKNYEIHSGIGIGQMYIVEKHSDKKQGSLRMWFIGYNAGEKEENRKHYKIYVKDAMVYNLIEVGNTYMVNVESTRKDKNYGYVYKLEQISNQEKYQLVGTGLTK
ncbi:hypothetical protein [Bacillus sp. AFS088145]|uniref:hypothetical protein n=1 Tax=Bacillus sp. AFS088145 TaxID=2033514 RepID=UPI000BFA6C00|nr:hypothetical protein [Bacillus sp. AFS088145]PFH82607.1 hypothetical protein COI44_19900 [Bacillus sp. AFS088145]